MVMGVTPIRPAKPYTCHECVRRKVASPNKLDAPGVCKPCYRDARGEEATIRLANATNSIHANRQWARAWDHPLIIERCNIGRWSMWVDGENTSKRSGEGIRSLICDDVFLALRSSPRVVITGADTGVGKTSLAVGLFRQFLDDAHRSYVDGKDAMIAFASGARFIAAIDLSDPNQLRKATETSYLVLDDAGKEGACGGFEAEKRHAALGETLDRRERSSHKRTIVTTPGGQDEWVRWYGGRIERLWWLMPGTAVLSLTKAT